MQGVEIGHCNAAIRAVLTANYTLLESSVKDVLEPVAAYGKNDTLGLDARPEIDIVQIMQKHDDNSVVITEETGAQRKLVFTHTHDPRAVRTTYISDPTDRSVYLKRFLLQVAADQTMKVGDVVGNAEAIAAWERLGGAPAEISGAFCALSCVRHAVPIFSVLMNYVTQDLFVCCSAGMYRLRVPDERPQIDLAYIQTHGARVWFPPLANPFSDDARRFVTFVGKEGYWENLRDSKLMSESPGLERLLHANEPGGPSRVLYLSSLQPADQPIGFILANGEKIGEWVHWLPWISFARREDDQSEPALSLFEIYRKDQVRMKGEVLMSTSPFYSIFKKREDGSGKMLIDIARFADFDNPSKIRATLLVCPTGNTWATGVVKQFGYRPIVF
jgi:hypothetical protein